MVHLYNVVPAATVSILLLFVKVSAFSKTAAESKLPPIVFVSRNSVQDSDPGAVPGIGPKHRTAKVGGKLMVRSSGGKVSQLKTDTPMFDVADLDVSWDGKSIVFAGLEHPDSSWRVFTVRSDGSQLRKITRSDRDVSLAQFGSSALLFETYDDFDPCFLPDGRIVFASTRYPSMASLFQVRTSNLFIVNADGTGLRRITTERNGAEEPNIDPNTGKIVYARWFVNIDRPSNVTKTGLTRNATEALTEDIGNLWQAVTIRPDGDEVKLYAAFARTRLGTQAYKPSIMKDSSLLCMFTPNTAMIPTVGGTGVRWFRKGPSVPHHVVGLRGDDVFHVPANIAPPFAVDPMPFGNNRILFSYSADGKDYGVYVINRNGNGLQKIVDLSGTLELDAHLLASRPLPRILQDNFPYEPALVPPTEDPITYANDDFFRFDCMNVFTNAAVDEPLPDAPRIANNARIRFFMSPQRQNSKGPDPSIFLKDAEVFYHGGVHEHDVPAEVPLFEQLVDEKGDVLATTDGKFAHVPGFNYERQGGGTKCVGCHAGHSMMEVPINGSVAEWFNLAPSATVTASSISGLFVPQQVVDRQARTGGDSVIWVSEEGIGAFVEMQWDFPIEAREFVLYSISRSNNTSHSLQDCELEFFKGLESVGKISTTGKISASGTRLRISPTKIDRAKITIKKFSGTILGKSVAGLAEIETNGRLLNTTSESKARNEQ